MNSELIKDILLVLLSGGIGAAIVKLFGDGLAWRRERRARKEDKAEEKADKTNEISKAVRDFQEKESCKNQEIDERLRKLEEQSSAQSEALKVILLDRVLHLGQSYINRGSISFDNRKRLRDMHRVYHDGLHGNGDADLVMEGVDALPLE